MELLSKYLRKITLFILTIFFISQMSPAGSETLKTIDKFHFQVQNAQKMTLSLYNNLIYFGEFQATVTSEGKIETIEKKSFQKLMLLFLVIDKYEDFVSRFGEYESITSQQLIDFGIDVFFENSNFKLDVRAPDTFLNPKHVSIAFQTIDQNQIDVYPSAYSAFLNYSLNQKFIEQKTVLTKKSQTSGALDPYINIKNTLFESHYSLDNEGYFIRNSSKITKDLVDKNIRVTVGDLNYFNRPFQTPYQYLGMSVSSAFDISPQSITVTTGEREIFLEVPSVVEIFINGFLIQSLTLEAGKHILEDIPITQGINHIALRVTDNSGKSKYILFQQTGSESMLKKGLHDFSYDIGSLSKAGAKKIEYKKNPVVSFYHRYGVNNLWTTGFNSQLKKNATIIGAENQIGSNRGLFVHHLSFSENAGLAKGVATRLSYIWTCPCGINDQIKRLTLLYEYQSPKFLSNLISESFVLNNLRHSVQMAYNQRLTDSISGIIQAGISTLDFKKLLSSQYSSGLNIKINDSLFSNLYWSKAISNNSTLKNESVILQFNYNFDGGKKNVTGTFSQNNNDKNVQGDYSYSANKSVDNRIYRARVTGDENNKSTFLSAYLNTQYNEFSSDYEYETLTKKNSLSLTPSGSLSFVDGKITLGQKINQSFVLVENELPESVIINGDEENHEAYLNSNSRAVLTNAQPYLSKSVGVISDDNKSLGLSNREYRVKSTNKSGSYLKLGNQLTKIIEGILVDANGAVLSLTGAKLVNLSTGKEIPFFTGRDGVFLVDNISPDAYQMIVYQKQQVKTLNLDLTNKLKEVRNNLGKLTVN